VALNIEAETAPLRSTPDGIIYVGKTRVPLETVIWTFNEGASAEEIVMHYDALSLADVYAVIAYYLNHRADVETYLHEAQEKSARVRQENEARFNIREFRERLLKRRQQGE
jgi:uncharacterized protein (DUF433 family)